MSKSLTVAFVTTEYVTEKNYDGGLANYIHRAALGLLECGSIPIVITASDKTESFFDNGILTYRVKIDRPWIYSVANFMTGFCINDGIKYIQLAKQLSKVVLTVISKHNVSVIQYPSCAGLALFKETSIPAIIRVSGFLPLYNQAYELPMTLNRYTTEQVEHWAYHRADSLYAPSHIHAQAVSEAIHKPVEVIETPFVIDTIYHDNSVYLELLDDKRYLLFFGTINLLKGARLIAEIIYTLLQQNMDINFVFVGKCVDYQGYLGINWLERIKTNAQEFSDRVIHINPLPHSQLYPIIKKSYFVVLPSREDNFPNTCLEAMAHKKLVIGTRGTSLEQMINHEENGLLFDKDNADDLLNTINEALNLPPERLEEIGEKAAQRIERLSPKYITMQMLEFYQNTIDNFSNLSNR